MAIDIRSQVAGAKQLIEFRIYTFLVGFASHSFMTYVRRVESAVVLYQSLPQNPLHTSMCSVRAQEIALLSCFGIAISHMHWQSLVPTTWQSSH
jgi:hypothetical protein